MTKRFLVPVLALAGFGVTARASITEYCNTGNCAATSAAFESAVTADSYTYASETDITFTGSLSDGGLQYLDTSTQVLFAASSTFSISGVTIVETANNTITINVPAAFSAIRLSLSQVTGGNDLTYIDSGQNYYAVLTSAPQEVGFLSPTPGSAWFVTIETGTGGERVQVDSFNPAGMQSQGSDTPEVGTLLLIGAGLISMRWMRRAQLRFFGTPQTT